jgi:cell filamentation protein
MNIFSKMFTIGPAKQEALHPFREGNGRVQRIFISQLAENAGHNLDYSALDQAALYPVMQASFHGDEVPLTDLILRIIA